jgi:hypothetical protein
MLEGFLLQLNQAAKCPFAHASNELFAALWRGNSVMYEWFNKRGMKTLFG